MAGKIGDVFGIHEQALQLRARRAEVLASNLANADTPNYKARDIDFQAVLREQAEPGGPTQLRVTHANHIGAANGIDGDLLYRQPYQASIDGNTVDADIEKAAFTENAVQYQATLSFIDGRLKSLMSAIKGS